MAECGDVWMSRKVDEGQSYNNWILAFSSAFTLARLTVGLLEVSAWVSQSSLKMIFPPRYGSPYLLHRTMGTSIPANLSLLQPQACNARFMCVTLHILSFESPVLYFCGTWAWGQPQPPAVVQRAALILRMWFSFRKYGGGSGRGLSHLVSVPRRV